MPAYADVSPRCASSLMLPLSTCSCWPLLQASYEQAQALCQAKGGTLPSLESKGDVNAFAALCGATACWLAGGTGTGSCPGVAVRAMVGRHLPVHSLCICAQKILPNPRASSMACEDTPGLAKLWSALCRPLADQCWVSPISTCSSAFALAHRNHRFRSRLKG